ncbi:MAG: polysaccharide deacetylase family protein [Clostridia bacterium]|nr:polysaccharide deacetylase family protein [Clostridia bacterium]
MWNGKKKAVTFSFDDGCRRDEDMVRILNKYGLKATFNLNSSLLGTYFLRDDNFKISPEEAKVVYKGHEIAAHTLSHPTLTKLPDDKTIAFQVEEDRLLLEKLCGDPVVGFAYPGNGDGATFDDRVVKIIREKTGIKYARTGYSTYDFDLPTDLFRLKPTVHVTDEKLIYLAEKFLALEADEPKLFYIWGHGFELDNGDGFDLSSFETFCRYIAFKDDVFYGTNRDVLL